MGKVKQHPRYNIISVRISDADLAELVAIKGSRSTTELLQQALTRLLAAEQQAHFDNHLRAHGL